MKCHDNHNNDGNNQGTSKKGRFSHLIMMALCCGAPVLILLLVPFLIKIGGSSIATPLTAIAPFICPIMMVIMIPMMLKGHRSKRDSNECHKTNEQIGDKTNQY